MDYDGYRRNGPSDLIRWSDGRQRALYASLEDSSRANGHEKHGIMVDYDVFVKDPPRSPGREERGDRPEVRDRPLHEDRIVAGADELSHRDAHADW